MAGFLDRYSRQSIALFWLAIVTIVLFTLLYFEQVAVLYILATLALVVLLLIVGFADLERVGREKIEGLAAKSD